MPLPIRIACVFLVLLFCSCSSEVSEPLQLGKKSEPSQPAVTKTQETPETTSEGKPEQATSQPGAIAASDSASSARAKRRAESRRGAPPGGFAPESATSSQRPTGSFSAQGTRPTRPSARTSSVAPAIRLFTGVALPQTLPTGTAMGFSVDYEFTEGSPSTSERYFWVITPGVGNPVRIPVRLETSGTLQTFVLEYRPEHGPFSCHIEDYRGNRLSNELPLQ